MKTAASRLGMWAWVIGVMTAMAVAAPGPREKPVQAVPVPAPDAPATQPAPLREQTIYIPYKKLRDVFEREGRGVFLPYEQFQELWRAAREKTQPTTTAAAPQAVLITDADSLAVVGKDVVTVTTKLRIEVLREGWVTAPLRLSDAAITRAVIGDQPARIVFTPERGYELLLQKTGNQPQVVELNLEYAKAIVRTPGQNSVSFEAPQAVVSRWRLRVPEAGVKLAIQPLLAATEVPATQSGGEMTEVLAFVGPAPTVRIDWTPKAEGATGLEALASAVSEQQVIVDEGVVRSRLEITYQISRAELTKLRLAVPDDYKLVGVADANVREWTVRPSEPGWQEVLIQLFEPAKGSQRLSVELERFIEDQVRQEVRAPVVRALDVGRQQGTVLVRVAPSLRAQATQRRGLVQIDAPQLSQAVAGGGWAFAYRYATLPFELVLAVEKIQPQITADLLVRAQLDPDELTLRTHATFDVQRAGVFSLVMRVPAGFEVRQVTGQAIGQAPAAQVEGHRLEGDDNTRLVVNLSHKALGPVGLAVVLVRRLEAPQLLTPTGQPANIEFALPQAQQVQQQTGRLLVEAPEALRVSVTQAQALRSIPFEEVLPGPELAKVRSSGTRLPVLAFAYAQQPALLQLAAERRRPYVTVKQVLTAKVDVGVVQYQATFFYNVRYSGIKTLRIDVPADLAGEIRNQTPGVRDTHLDPAPADVAPGMAAWSFASDREFLGDVVVRLAWERKIDKLGVGQSVDLILPHLAPRQVDRAWGQILLAKTETIDVREAQEPQGLRPIDPQQDVAPEARAIGAAQAFEFHDDWTLVVRATHYRLEEVKRTSIERAVLRMVITRGQETAVQAVYYIRSAQQRLPIDLPQGVQFDAQPVRVNGRPVTLERGDQNRFFVPLADQTPQEPFVLDLRYTRAGQTHRLEMPVFPDDPAMQKVYLYVYLPPQRLLLAWRGLWSDQTNWRLRPLWRWQAQPRREVTELLHWVAPQQVSSVMEGFQTDGTAHLFSTMGRPAVGQGTLTLVTMDRTWLRALVLGVLLIGGLVLLPASRATRWLAVGATVVALVVLGVFLPTLLRHLLDQTTLAVMLIVLVVWFLEYVLWTRPRLRKRELHPAATVVPPSAPPPPDQPPANPPTSGPQPGQGE